MLLEIQKIIAIDSTNAHCFYLQLEIYKGVKARSEEGMLSFHRGSFWIDVESKQSWSMYEERERDWSPISFLFKKLKCLVESKTSRQSTSEETLQHWAVVLAQLVERSLPMPEVRGSNTANCIEKAKIKTKRPGMTHLKTVQHFLLQHYSPQFVWKSVVVVDVFDVDESDKRNVTPDAISQKAQKCFFEM